MKEKHPAKLICTPKSKTLLEVHVKSGKRLLSAALSVLMLCAAFPAFGAAAEQNVPIDAAHFPDNNFRAKIKARYDVDKDGALSYGERTGVTSIFIPDEQICDLSGIEYFPAVESLGLYGNTLTFVDLSRNTALKYLDVDETRIKTLDLSRNTALETLHCSSNGLTSLDLSRNTALKTLSCSRNGLTITPDNGQYDLSKLPAGFDLSKTSDWTGGSVKDGILTFDSGCYEVSYVYDTGFKKVVFELYDIKGTSRPETPISNGVQASSDGKKVLYKNGRPVTGTKLYTLNSKTYAVVNGFISAGKRNHLVKIRKNTYAANPGGVIIKAKKSAKVKIIKIGSKRYAVNAAGKVFTAKKKYMLVKGGKRLYIVNRKGVVLTKKSRIKIGKKVYKTNAAGTAKIIKSK